MSSIKQEILKLRKQGSTYSAIVNKLNVAKSTVAYHCKAAGLDSRNRAKEITESMISAWQIEYDSGNTVKEIAKTHNFSKTTIRNYIQLKPALTQEQKKEKDRSRKKRERRELKQKAVDYKGGCCEKCGYNKCLSALEFHHLDPEEKDFGIGGRTMQWESVRKEIDKCILVCSNCHREIHEELENGVVVQ